VNPFNPPTCSGLGHVQIFFGSLITESGWVDSLIDQPVIGRVRPDQVIHFDSSTRGHLLTLLALI